MRTVFVAVAAAAAVALSACGSAHPWEGTALDEWGWYACEDFANEMTKAGGSQMSEALPPAQRAQFAVKVSQSAGRSTTPLIKDAGVVLLRTAGGAQSTWKLGMDTFAARCLDRGFKAV